MIKILIVDDEVSKLHTIRDVYLDGYDVHLEMATSYLSAVNKLRDNEYHIVISDENLPDEENCLLGTGHGLKKAHLTEHPDCKFILYTACPELIENRDVRADCVAFGEPLQKAIQNTIYLLSLPKTEDEKPQNISTRNGEPMANPVKTNWSLLIAALAFIGTIMGSYGTYAVTTYKVDSTDAKVSSHCSDNEIFKEKTEVRFVSGELATARLEEQTKTLTDAVKELTQELKRNRRQ